MKILILASPRSGSTSLFNALYKNLNNYKGFCEPFNIGSESLGDPVSEYSLNYENLIVKLLSIDIFHLKDLTFNFVGHLYAYNYIDMEFIQNCYLPIFKDYTKLFNKTILLTRKNIFEASKSFSYSTNTGKFHKKYYYDNKYWNPITENIITNHSKVINFFSENLDIPLIFYEDLFSGNKKYIIDFINYYQFPIQNLNIFFEDLNPKNRYRQV